MTNQILLTGQAYRNFIETIHSPFSRISYKNSLVLYMQFRRIQDCNQLIEEDPKIRQSQFIDYVISLREINKLNAKNDIFFGPHGSLAFQKDLKDVEVHLLNTGHLPLKEDLDVRVSLIGLSSKYE
jgi:hypothetical protein